MQRGRIDKTSFAAGELSPEMFDRRDLPHLVNGAERLRNFMLLPQGTAETRDGLARVAAIAAGDQPQLGLKLVPFAFSEAQRYLFLFLHQKARIRLPGDGGEVAVLSTPWSAAELAEIDWTQALDTLIVCHEDHRPRRIVRQGADDSWAIENAPMANIPLFAFGRTWPHVAVTPAAATGSGVTLTASAAWFTALDVGATIAGNGGAATIAGYSSPTAVTIDITDGFNSTAQIPAGGWSFDMSTARAPGMTLSAYDVGDDRTITFARDWAESWMVGSSIGDGAAGVAEITEWISPRRVKADISADFSGTSIAGGTWTFGPADDALEVATSPREPLWSNRRGWPRTATFDEDRLVYAGSRALPNAVVHSKSGDYFDFDEGEGLADEAVVYRLLSDQSNPIVGVRSGENLEIFTVGAVFATRGRPITPDSLATNEVARPGAAPIKPVSIEGATVYVTAGGEDDRQSLLELVWNDAQQAYAVTDLALLAGHLMNGPTGMALRRSARGKRANHLFVPMEDGSCAVLNTMRTQDVTGWTHISSPGNSGEDAILAVCVLGSEVTFAVRRELAGQTVYQLERLDPDRLLDSSIMATLSPASATVTGLSAFEGCTVHAVADGVNMGEFTVTGGEITLPRTASVVEVGLSFPWQLVPMPPSADGPQGPLSGERKRMLRVTVSLMDTTGGRIRLWGSHREGAWLPHRVMEQSTFDAPPPSFTGYRDIRLLGVSRTGQVELYGEAPFRARVRSVLPEIGV